MLNYLWKVEVCKKEEDDFKPFINTPFKSFKLAEEFIKRNKYRFINLKKRISCYKEGNLLFSRYFWHGGD